MEYVIPSSCRRVIHIICIRLVLYMPFVAYFTMSTKERHRHFIFKIQPVQIRLEISLHRMSALSELTISTECINFVHKLAYLSTTMKTTFYFVDRVLRDAVNSQRFIHGKVSGEICENHPSWKSCRTYILRARIKIHNVYSGILRTLCKLTHRKI